MTETEQAVQAVLDDILVGVLEVLIKMAMGEFGEIDEEVGSAIAGALGAAVGDVGIRADAARRDRLEGRRDLPDWEPEGCLGSN